MKVFKVILVAAALTLLTRKLYSESFSAKNLKKYKWRNRLILVFDNTEGLGQEQESKFSNKEMLDDRDIKVIEIPAGRLPIRKKYGIEPDEFQVVLIGKDGGEKSRSGALTEAEVFYAEIDKMPMRKREMKEKTSEVSHDNKEADFI